MEAKDESPRAQKLRLRHERLAVLYPKGLTDKQLAERLGCHTSAVHDWRVAQQPPLPPNHAQTTHSHHLGGVKGRGGVLP